MLGEKLDVYFGEMKFYISQLASCLELNKEPPLPRPRTGFSLPVNSQYITEIVDNLIYKTFVWYKTNVFGSF